MADTVRCWLVDRTYSDKGLVSLTYATPDGKGLLRRERAPHALDAEGVPAAVEVPAETLIDAEATECEQYADEAERMASRHAPNDRV
jgi:hypothetical protein